ncbi:hypothetical protein [Delftia sp. DS1230]|uniref:hypothetical protein n=1 Tax=Delftia sp. DS1230 TaxID=3153805 RepID=UPI0032D958F3
MHATSAHARGTSQCPDSQQMMALAIRCAEHRLEVLVATIDTDNARDETDVEVELVAELALHHIRRMKSMEFSSGRDFDNEWYRARAAVALAVQAFSRPDSVYGKRLSLVLRGFDEGASFVEFVEQGMT